MPAEVHVWLRPRTFRRTAVADLKKVADEVVEEKLGPLSQPQSSSLASWHVTGGAASQLYVSGGADCVVYKVETYPAVGHAELHVSLSAAARPEDAAKPPEERGLGREDHQRLRSLCNDLVRELCDGIRKRKVKPDVTVTFVDGYGEYSGVSGQVRGLGRRVVRSWGVGIGLTGATAGLLAVGLWISGYLRNGTVRPSDDILLAAASVTIAAVVIVAWQASQHYFRGQRNEVQYEA